MNQQKLDEAKAQLQASLATLEHMILKTPTGELRNALTSVNIHIGVAYINLKTLKLKGGE
jgi:hypothetical protein